MKVLNVLARGTLAIASYEAFTAKGENKGKVLLTSTILGAVAIGFLTLETDENKAWLTRLGKGAIDAMDSALDSLN